MIAHVDYLLYICLIMSLKLLYTTTIAGQELCIVMEKKKIRYPIGEQSFEELRKRDCLYVDKTAMIERLIDDGSKYYFLGRPRRFGKSLFLSTLACFFEAKRELFHGLYIDSVDWKWEPYPVLYLDLNVGDYSREGSLEEVLDNQFHTWEEKYGLGPSDLSLGLRLQSIITSIARKTNKGVVILVDEYDKPLVNNINNPELAERFRNTLSSVYANFKSSGSNIRMVFMTGVSRFGHLSVFSGLNNINDISFDTDYSDICGITEQELADNFTEGITALSETSGLTRKEILSELRKFYDGYRFAPYGADIYNPFSILKVMSKRFFDNYWIESGTPTLLAELLKKSDANLLQITNSRCDLGTLKSLDSDNTLPTALLYQSGYLTIKSYDSSTRLATLGLPNEEVKRGFMEFLLPYYTNLHGESAAFASQKFVEAFKRGDAEDVMRRLQAFLSSISYRMHMDSENNIQNTLLVLMTLAGLETEAELCTSAGRIDLFVKTDKYYYIIELKRDGTAEEALAQINGKDYALPFSLDSREVIKIGANFSTTTRTLDSWLIERCPDTN